MLRPPFSPFHHGAPRFQVGLAPIDASAWLLPDWEAQTLPEKRRLLDERRHETCAAVPDSAAAREEAGEAMAAVLGGADFWDAGRRASDDFCVMEKRGGRYVLTSAMVCAPSHWRLSDVIGRELALIHGPVPDRLGEGGASGLADRITRVFDGLRPDLVLERFNWTVQAGALRFAPSSAPLQARAAAAAASEALDLLHLRVERQTIRKLPRTGAVLFTIRVSLDPLRVVLAETGAAAAFESAWNGAAAHVRAYKGWDAYESLVRAALQQTR